MEQYLGRKLTKDETIDHLNRDKSDNRIENLQVKPRQQHIKEDIKRVKPIEIICIWCGKKALKKANYLAWAEKQNKAGPFCNKSCVGKYGSAIKNRHIEKLQRIPTPKREYFYLEKEWPS